MKNEQANKMQYSKKSDTLTKFLHYSVDNLNVWKEEFQPNGGAWTYGASYVKTVKLLEFSIVTTFW